MQQFTWMLPHVTLQNHEDDTVLFSAQADSKEEAMARIIEHLAKLEMYGWSLQYRRWVQEWLTVSDPVIRESTDTVCVSNGNVNSLKGTRRRIRAARAMESVAHQLFSDPGRALSTVELG